MVVSTLSRRLLDSVSKAALAAAIMAAPSGASAAACDWAGGSGLWTTGGSWSCGAEPGSADAVTIITAGSVVSISGIGANAGTIDLENANQLNITNSNLAIFGGSIVDNGTITVGANSRLQTGAGPLSITGSGTLVMDNSSGFVHLFESGGVNTLGAGLTVRGSGQMGLNNAVIVNNGLISADVGGGTIEIDAAGGNGGLGGGGVGTGNNAGLLNNATMQASHGGTLLLDGGLYENAAGGVILANTGSTVALGGDSRVVNGTLKTLGTGVISAANTTQYLQNVTLASGSALSVINDSLQVNTSLVNNGTITLGAASRLQSDGSRNLSITGTGSIVLDNSGGFTHLFENGGIMTLGAGQTVSGAGNIGLNSAVIVNNGVINANVSGGNLDIDAAGGNGGVGVGNGVGTNTNSSFLNNGTLEATNGGTLSFEGGLYENGAAGLIKADVGSTVSLNGDSRILNGVIQSVGTGVIQAVNTTQYLQNVTLASGSTLNINNDSLLLNTSFVNNGTITVGPNGRLETEGGQNMTISGTGTIIMDSTGGFSHLFESGGVITLGSNQKIEGSGEIGLNNAAIVNNNVFTFNNGSNVDLDVAGGNGGIAGGLGTSGKAGFLNNGTVSVDGASTLSIEGGYYDNSPGAINATNGSTINLNGDSRIVGGTLSADATSVINADNTTQYLQSVTLASGTKLSVNNDNLLLNTSLINNGTVSVTANSRLDAETAALSITGTGSIVLDNSGGFTHLFENGGIDTLGSGQTVSGAGNIGLNNPVIVNNGVINANVNGGNLDIDAAGGNGGVGTGNGVGTNTNSSFLNNGTLEATNGGTLSFEGGLYENGANGVIKADVGSTVSLNGDSRILNGVIQSVGTGVINADGTTQYLENVTLAAGSNLSVNNDNLLLNTSLINNGTVSLTANSRLDAETAALSITGTGSIVLDNSGGFVHLFENGGIDTLGSGQTVSGSGQIGLNNPVIVNNGVINANVSAGGIDIDVAGGNGGVGAGNGVGTNGNSAMLNTGTLEASNGSTLSFEGGLYENSASGAMTANTGGTVVMNGDASLFNLQAGGVLNKGVYASTTTGAQSTLNLRSNAANSIVTIGTASGSGTDTIVTLSGANSVLEVTPFSGGTPATIDSTLTGVAQSGELQLLNGRDFTVVAGGGAFSNAGIVQLGASTLGATSYTNSGTTFGNGAVTVAIANTGTVNATGGTLNTQAITGTTGTISTDATGTLNLGGASTAGFLTNDGHLALNTNNITVTSDYQNANFGVGNAFFGHANVSGSGLILAASATMDLSGPAFSGGNLNVGNVRTGGSSSTTLTITNNGTLTTLRGAVQDTNAPSITLTNANFVLNPNGGSSTATVSYTGTMAGSLAGQTLNVVNNFDNVAAKTINLQGNVYQVAVAASQPATITLAAQRVGGGPSTSTISIGNVAPNTPNFTESLSATASTTSPFALNGGTSVTTSNLQATQSQNVTLSLGTGAAGAFSGMVNIANTSIPVAGSGFTPLGLAGQSINVSGNVYGVAVANLSSNTVNFGVVRQGTANVTGGLTVTNGAIGSLTDNLSTTVGATPSNVTSTGTPGSLAQNQSGAANFLLDTSTAGQVGGSTSLGFTSTDAELAPMALASQTVNFTGTVTQLAQALLQMTGGAGTFGGSGTSYTLNLGTIAAGTGSLSTNLDVLNNIPNSSFAEQLGGGFSGGTTGGFTFNGPSFSGVAGGQASPADLLGFTYTGLGAGTYRDVITLDAFSHFAGLTDQSLAPITLTVTADIQGMRSGVPEPATWAELLFGFGFLGGVLRRRAKAPAKAGLVV